MRPYPTIPEQASDKELLQLALEYMGHRSSCQLPASNFQKHQPCKCGKDALVALIKASASEKPAHKSERANGPSNTVKDLMALSHCLAGSDDRELVQHAADMIEVLSKSAASADRDSIIEEIAGQTKLRPHVGWCLTDVEIRALKNEPASSERSIYWLIERGSPAEWWVRGAGKGDGTMVEEHWTRDASKAQRFNEWGARAHAKELESWGVKGPLRVEQHMDCDGPVIAPSATSPTNAVELLKRIRQWDMLDVTGDGPYWKGEIDKALGA